MGSGDLRTFAIKERNQITFRAEAFNITNSLRPGNPGLSVERGKYVQPHPNGRNTTGSNYGSCARDAVSPEIRLLK